MFAKATEVITLCLRVDCSFRVLGINYHSLVHFEWSLRLLKLFSPCGLRELELKALLLFRIWPQYKNNVILRPKRYTFLPPRIPCKPYQWYYYHDFRLLNAPKHFIYFCIYAVWWIRKGPGPLFLDFHVDTMRWYPFYLWDT